MLATKTYRELAQSVPTIKIDWALGNELVLKKLNDIIALRAPDVIIISHKAYFDETAVVEASFPKFPGKCVRFTVQPKGAIEIESDAIDDEEMIRFASEFISSVLGYSWREMTQTNGN